MNDNIVVRYLVVLFNGKVFISLRRPRTWRRLLFYLNSNRYTHAVIEAIYFSDNGICLGAIGGGYRKGIDELPQERNFRNDDMMRDIAELHEDISRQNLP